MFELPLFPLNTVLFPGMPLGLHIFEARYKRMINRCVEENQPFGVVLIRHGLEALGPLAEPHEIGCTARILEVERLDEGQMNISALGQHRFRILSTRTDQPYLVGQVELFPLDEHDAPALAQTSQALRPWVEKYMEILSSISETPLDANHLPSEPLVLAYLAAVLLQVPAHQKQSLLATENAADFISEIHSLYRKEVPLLQTMLAKVGREQGGNMSLN